MEERKVFPSGCSNSTKHQENQDQEKIWSLERALCEQQGSLVQYLQYRARRSVEIVVKKFPVYDKIREDLEQEAFVRCWEACTKPRYSNLTWDEFERLITTIIRNHFNNFFHRHKYWSSSEVSLDPANEEDAHDHLENLPGECSGNSAPTDYCDTEKALNIFIGNVLSKIGKESEKREFLETIRKISMCDFGGALTEFRMNCVKSVKEYLREVGMSPEDFVYVTQKYGRKKKEERMPKNKIFTKAELLQVAREIGYSEDLTGSSVLMDLQLERGLQKILDSSGEDGFELDNVSDVTIRWLVEHGFLESEGGLSEELDSSVVAVAEEEKDSGPEEDSDLGMEPEENNSELRSPEQILRESAEGLGEMVREQQSSGGGRHREGEGFQVLDPLPTDSEQLIRDKKLKIRTQIMSLLGDIVEHLENSGVAELRIGQNFSVILCKNEEEKSDRTRRRTRAENPKGSSGPKTRPGRKATVYSLEEQEKVDEIAQFIEGKSVDELREILKTKKIPASEAERLGLPKKPAATLLDLMRETSSDGTPIPKNVWIMRAKRLLYTHAANSVSGRKIGF